MKAKGYRPLPAKDNHPLAWDIFFLYGPDARWEEVPLPVVSSGSTIIARKDRLKEFIAQLLEVENGDHAAN